LRFDWDETKDAINLRKHGIGIEMADGALLLLVAHTVEDEDEEVVRIISARRATAQERSRYEDDH
jgi:uncharacterized DUF497 family protein